MKFLLSDRLVEAHGRAKELVGLAQAVETAKHYASLGKPAAMTDTQYAQRVALLQLSINILESQLLDAVQSVLATYILDAHHLAQFQSQGINSLILDRIAIIQQARPDDEAFTFGELKSWFKN